MIADVALGGARGAAVPAELLRSLEFLLFTAMIAHAWARRRLDGLWGPKEPAATIALAYEDYGLW
jgi:hypothetical protein